MPGEMKSRAGFVPASVVLLTTALTPVCSPCVQHLRSRRPKDQARMVHVIFSQTLKLHFFQGPFGLALIISIPGLDHFSVPANKVRHGHG